MPVEDDDPQSNDQRIHDPSGAWPTDALVQNNFTSNGDGKNTYSEPARGTAERDVNSYEESNPFLFPESERFGEPLRASHYRHGFGCSRSETTCNDENIDASDYKKTNSYENMYDHAISTEEQMEYQTEAATQTSDCSSTFGQNRRRRVKIQGYMQQLQDQEARISSMEMDLSNSLSNIQELLQPNIDGQGFNLQKFLQLRTALDKTATDLAAKRDALAFLRQKLSKQEQVLEQRKERWSRTPQDQHSAHEDSSWSVLSRGNVFEGADISAAPATNGAVDPSVDYNDFMEPDLPPTIVLDDFVRSSTVKTTQSQELYRFHRSAGSHTSFHPSILNSPQPDQDYEQDIADIDLKQQSDSDIDVNCTGYQFLLSEDDIQMQVQCFDGSLEADADVHRKRERDLASIMELSPFTGAYRSTNFENIIDSAAVTDSLGGKISYWILQIFLYSWLELSRYIRIAGSEPDFEECFLSLGCIHLTSLIYANWFGDSTMVEYHAVLTFRPSISSNSNDIPRYFQQIYIGDSNEGHYQTENIQLIASTRSRGTQQTSSKGQIDQSDRSGNSRSQGSSRVWSPQLGNNGGTFDTDVEGMDMQLLATRPFVGFGRSRISFDSDERQVGDRSPEPCDSGPLTSTTMPMEL